MPDPGERREKRGAQQQRRHRRAQDRVNDGGAKTGHAARKGVGELLPDRRIEGDWSPDWRARLRSMIRSILAIRIDRNLANWPQHERRRRRMRDR